MSTSTTPADTMSLQEAADRLGISRTHLGTLARRDRLPGGLTPIRLGQRIVIGRDELAAFLAGGAAQAPAPAPPPDFGRVLIRARLAAIEAERAVLTAYLGEDDAGLFSRTAASARIAPTGGSAAYPPAGVAGRGTHDHDAALVEQGTPPAYADPDRAAHHGVIDGEDGDGRTGGGPAGGGRVPRGRRDRRGGRRDQQAHQQPGRDLDAPAVARPAARADAPGAHRQGHVGALAADKRERCPAPTEHRSDLTA